MAVRFEDTDKAIAEVTGSFDGVDATKRGYRELHSKERHIVGLDDRLWKLPAVPVTTWHMPCTQYDGIYEFPEESHYFSYLPVESHMKELWQRSISCTCLSGNDADQDGAYNGDYSFVFANPEALVLNEKWRKMIQTPIYLTNLFGIVADEAHVIPKW